jgi:hypothetical protein
MNALPSMPADRPGALGLDIDGTITEHPKYFARLARAFRDRGQPVHVVSSRSPIGEADTLKELAELGIPYDFLYLLPDFGKPIPQCPHGELSWYEQYLWQKLAYCQAHDVTAFYDDDPRVLTLFARYAPHIRTNEAWPGARPVRPAGSDG